MVSAYWVVQGVLAAGPYPASVKPRRTRAKLGGLLDWGVRAFVDLTEPDELTGLGPLRPYGEALVELAQAAELEVSIDRFPIPDMGVPDRAEMQLILDRLDAHRASGITSYVHCLAGKGRTGTVVGCYLARHGAELLSPSRGDQAGRLALETLVRLRREGGIPHPWESPQTEAQVRLVASWKPGE